jgi:hypothetical protein
LKLLSVNACPLAEPPVADDVAGAVAGGFAFAGGFEFAEVPEPPDELQPASTVAAVANTAATVTNDLRIKGHHFSPESEVTSNAHSGAETRSART